MVGRCFQYKHLQETLICSLPRCHEKHCWRGTIPAMRLSHHWSQKATATMQCLPVQHQHRPHILIWLNPYIIITNNTVRMLNLRTTFCHRYCFHSALINSDSRITARVSKSPAKQELPQSDSFSFLHKWQLVHSATKTPLRHIGQTGVTHLEEGVMTEEGYVTFHRRCGDNKLLKSNPKPFKWIVFPLPSGGPGLVLISLSLSNTNTASPNNEDINQLSSSPEFHFKLLSLLK